MYIKIFGSIFLLTSAAAIGYLKADELKERARCLNALKRMMILLQGELRFHRATLSEAFENAADEIRRNLERIKAEQEAERQRKEQEAENRRRAREQAERARETELKYATPPAEPSGRGKIGKAISNFFKGLFRKGR